MDAAGCEVFLRRGGFWGARVRCWGGVDEVVWGLCGICGFLVSKGVLLILLRDGGARAEVLRDRISDAGEGCCGGWRGAASCGREGCGVDDGE